MKIYMIAVGNRMPKWVQQGYLQYAKRMPIEWSMELLEIQAEKKTKNMNRNVILKKEYDRYQSRIAKNSLKIVLDVHGKAWDTEMLAQQLDAWRQDGRPVSLIIGGAEGLDERLKESADFRWSLSPLTLPHPLVRIIVAEQVYRAWTLLNNHPYHRGE